MKQNPRCVSRYFANIASVIKCNYKDLPFRWKATGNECIAGITEIVDVVIHAKTVDDILFCILRVPSKMLLNFSHLYGYLTDCVQNYLLESFTANSDEARSPISNDSDRNGFIVQRGLLAANVSLSERISLGYPVTELYGRRVNIQPNFHGVVSLNNTMMNSTEIDEGDSSILISNMVFAKMLTLLYREERTGDWTDKQVTDYELSIVNYFQRAGLSMLPYLIVGFAIMSVYLAIVACICPFMANATAIGILLSMGVRYGSILCITPFLVLAIGKFLCASFF
uniref:SSD domain-containing protein n=1 Tax=Parascaris equorum TaxID=6256 RepID=A0A914RZR7_PAREQ